MSRKERELVWYKKSGKMIAPKRMKTGRALQTAPTLSLKGKDEYQAFAIRLDAAIKKAVYE